MRTPLSRALSKEAEASVEFLNFRFQAFVEAWLRSGHRISALPAWKHDTLRTPQGE